MPKAAAERIGRLIARALTGAWRSTPPALTLTPPDFDKTAPFLLASGAGALGWRGLSRAGLSSIAHNDLLQAYRLHSIQAAVHEQRIQKVFRVLAQAELEPVLVKGWAVARIYPEPGLRPYGDIDLCLPPEQLTAARSVLDQSLEQFHSVDLHHGFTAFGGGSFEQILNRAASVKLGDIWVRTPSPEDHLRLICIHMLREGAWRPLWLCDVAAAVESRLPDFDWTVCLGDKRQWQEWITCALRLAHELLGADISDTPAVESRKPLPPWLIPTMMREWGSPQTNMARRHRAPMASYRQHALGLLRGLRDRWPNPIEATVARRRAFNRFPPLPFQLTTYITRGARFALKRKPVAETL